MLGRSLIVIKLKTCAPPIPKIMQELLRHLKESPSNHSRRQQDIRTGKVNEFTNGFLSIHIKHSSGPSVKQEHVVFPHLFQFQCARDSSHSVVMVFM